MEEKLNASVAYASAHGLLYGDAKDSTRCHHAPMTLVPTKFPKDSFLKGVGLALNYNLLVDKVSRDLDWVYNVLNNVLEYDTFTHQLVQICKKVESEDGVKQRTYLGINRSDYMLDKADKNLLQIELNTIASSFGCLSARVSKTHRFLMQRYYHDNNLLKNTFDSFDEKINLPINKADIEIPKGLAYAAQHYCQKYDNDNLNTTTILFVVQEGERNAFDQR